MSKTPIFEAECILNCQNNIGEGALWDEAHQLVRWVDIDEHEVHAYDPSSKKYGVDSYAETAHIGNITLTKSGKSLMAMFHHEIALIPLTEATEVLEKPNRKPQKAIKILGHPMSEPYNEEKFSRLNDGGCDAQGRLLAGSMAFGELKGKHIGEFIRFDPDGTRTQILKPGEVITGNGISWSPDGSKLYWSDSGKPEVSVFDYDQATGTPSNRRQFISSLPPAIDEFGQGGVFDGMTVDGNGNVWIARWRERRIVGYNPDGKIIAYIRCPGAICVTIPCFGGPNLDQMYIATARAGRVGEPQEKYPQAGNLFRLDFGPGSEIRKILGEDWKGATRNAFGV